MQTKRSRPWRKSRIVVALTALSMALALSAAPVQAVTGGVSAGGGEGVVASGADLAFGPLRVAGATWYGPGLYGHHTACGELLKPSTIGVAHRSLPCGTAVKFVYHGRSLVTTVIDRGPYTRGNSFDLTNGARRALGFEGADQVRYAVAVAYARR